MSKQWTGKKLRTRTLDSLWVVVAIILVSTLPYLNEVFTVKTEKGAEWAHLFGLHQFLPDAETRVLGFSGYRMFLYTLLMFLFTTLGWLCWYLSSKFKPYHNALLIPVVLGFYQIFMILGGWRSTLANSWEVKTGLIFTLALVLFFSQLRHKHFKASTILKWAFIILVTCMPFFHDIITEKSTAELRWWVPNIGLENILKDDNGKVLGFGSYRAAVYFFLLHFYAHLGWLGSFIYYNHNRKAIRPFLLVPVIISFFSLILFILDIQETPFGAPDIKFYITIGLSVLLAWNLFFNDKTGRTKQLETNKSV